jgi:hypothetical protein
MRRRRRGACRSSARQADRWRCVSALLDGIQQRGKSADRGALLKSARYRKINSAKVPLLVIFQPRADSATAHTSKKNIRTVSCLPARLPSRRFREVLQRRAEPLRLVGVAAQHDAAMCSGVSCHVQSLPSVRSSRLRFNCRISRCAMSSSSCRRARFPRPCGQIGRALPPGMQPLRRWPAENAA